MNTHTTNKVAKPNKELIGIGAYMVNLNDHVNKAADQNLYLKFRIPKTGGVLWFATDTSRFCR